MRVVKAHAGMGAPPEAMHPHHLLLVGEGFGVGRGYRSDWSGLNSKPNSKSLLGFRLLVTSFPGVYSWPGFRARGLPQAVHPHHLLLVVSIEC